MPETVSTISCQTAARSHGRYLRSAAGGLPYVVVGDGLLHPLVLAALTLMVVNDHVLKSAFPGPITGKLSDVGGLLFFPLALQAAWEWLTSRTGMRSLGSQTVLVIAIMSTAAIFSAIKLFPVVSDAYAEAIALSQWLAGLLLGTAGARPAHVLVATDPTDLMALPVLALSYWIGSGRRTRRIPASSGSVPRSHCWWRLRRLSPPNRRASRRTRSTKNSYA